MATKSDFQLFRGEDITAHFLMNPTVNITGWEIKFYCGTLEIEATVVDGESGIFQVELTRAQTASLTPGSGKRYDVWRTDTDTNRTLAYGLIDVMDVARPLPSP